MAPRASILVLKVLQYVDEERIDPSVKSDCELIDAGESFKASGIWTSGMRDCSNRRDSVNRDQPLDICGG